MELKASGNTFARFEKHHLPCTFQLTRPLSSVTQCISLNNTFASLIRSSERLQLVTEPSLALTVFRLVPPSPSVSPADSGIDLSAISSPTNNSRYDTNTLNELNQTYMARLTTRSDIMLTQTTLNGMYCIRLAVGAARTKEDDVRRAWEIVEEEADMVLKEWSMDKSGAF